MLRHKFHATPVVHDGIHFDSKKEGARYETLKLLRAAGEVLFFTLQMPFRLPGGVKYVCDFMVFWADETVTFEDVKGFRTESYKAKKRMVEDLYRPVKITEL